jgi:hypothetical protein
MVLRVIYNTNVRENQITRCHSPENHNTNPNHPEKLKSGLYVISSAVYIVFQHIQDVQRCWSLQECKGFMNGLQSILPRTLPATLLTKGDNSIDDVSFAVDTFFLAISKSTVTEL